MENEMNLEALVEATAGELETLAETATEVVGDTATEVEETVLATEVAADETVKGNPLS